jgi:hypothetical protein
MQLRFVVPGLLGDTPVNIDPSDVQVVEAPTDYQPNGDSAISHLVGLTYQAGGVQAHFYDEVNTPNTSVCYSGVCTITTSHFQRDDNYVLNFSNAITAPGNYVPVEANLFDSTLGTGQYLGESHNTYSDVNGIVCGVTCNPTGAEIDGLSIVATPEPNTGFLVGACFLLCAAVAFRRKIRSHLRTIPKTL